MPPKPTFLVDAGPAGLQLSLCKLSRLEGWRVRSLRAPFWRCYCPITAGGLVVWNGKEILLTPGRSMLIAPYTAFAADLRQPFVKAYCHFNCDVPRARIEPGVYPFDVGKEVLGVLRDLAGAESSRPVELQLISLMLEQACHGLRQLPAGVIAPVSGDQRIRASVALMKQNLATPLVNADLAAAVNLQENSFVRYFRQHAGEPPQKRYRRLRLEHACHLLMTTDDSIEQIAAACGFWDRNHFTRAFSRQWHVPPAAFRRQNR